MQISEDWLIFGGLLLLVLAFAALSLSVAATGTARFAVAMGYDAHIGYVVGIIFEGAKEVLPVAFLALFSRLAVVRAAFIGVAWICLVVYSFLATHATINSAIRALEQTGAWKMEVRSNKKAQLTTVEQQIAAISRPNRPRPVKTVREALTATSVPPSVWKNSDECRSIQDSAHFASACSEVVGLRRELAAALDFERLSVQAAALRKGLAQAPIVATNDPLPAAFNATVGRLVPIAGPEGVALLVTAIVEIVSCCGLAWLRALQSRSNDRELSAEGSGPENRDHDSVREGRLDASCSLRRRRAHMIPQSSLSVGAAAVAAPPLAGREGLQKKRSTIFSGQDSSLAGREGASAPSQGGRINGSPAPSSHVPEFVRELLDRSLGSSIRSRDLRTAYEGWCTARGHQPISPQKFSCEMRAMGYEKWKSDGRMRYRHLRFATRSSTTSAG
jgi:hypothetical protein